MSEDIDSTGRSRKEELKEKAETALKTGKTVASGISAWWSNLDSQKKRKYIRIGIIVLAVIIALIILCCCLSGDPIQGKWKYEASAGILSTSITMDIAGNGTGTMTTTMGKKTGTNKIVWQKVRDRVYKIGSGTARLSDDGKQLDCDGVLFWRA